MTQEEQITELRSSLQDAQMEIRRLQELLRANGIPYEAPKVQVPEATEDYSALYRDNFTLEELDRFIMLFRGRTDVYARRFQSRKTGRSGYSPECSNFWRYGVCPKRDHTKIRCIECPNKAFVQLTRSVYRKHLLGLQPDASDVIGVYPMLLDETCYFLVFDFDNHSPKNELPDNANADERWMQEVNSLRAVCRDNGIEPLVERSRSGKGAHVWFFFSEAVPARTARAFGAALLTKGAETVNETTFKTYDRMLPLQDHIPDSSAFLGNLIALPMQGQALRNGNSAFVDDHWHCIRDPWKHIAEVKKLSLCFIEGKIKEWAPNGIWQPVAEDMSGESEEDNPAQMSMVPEQPRQKPWDKKDKLIDPADVPGKLHITKSNMIYISKAGIKPRALNRMRRLALFSNQDFYKKQAMGYSVRGLSRYVYCGDDLEEYLCLPRGCEDKLLDLLNSSGVKAAVNDQRQAGNPIRVSFKGALRPGQDIAAEKMLSHDIGICNAATGFGKTVIGAYIIGALKVNTLVLVHNREIMKVWQKDFEDFLQIDEEPPIYQTKTQTRRRKDVVGTLYASHDSLTGIIDIAMITSLGKEDNIDERVKDYGLVIVDECHHIGADTLEQVIRQVSAKHVYGLTATTKRDDGLEQKVFMQLGPVRFKLTAKQRAAQQSFRHLIYPRFTGMANLSGEEMKIQEAYAAIVHDERRNTLIVNDVLACVSEGRTPLILTRYRDHADELYKLLKNKVRNLILLKGGGSASKKNEVKEKLLSVPADEALALVAVGKYVGEGFDYPRLDTLMLAAPVAWRGIVEQYAGRIQRDYEDKKDVIIYDYVDSRIRVFERMYRKRLTSYKRIGYEMYLPASGVKLEKNSIFDCETITSAFLDDLKTVKRSIVISTPGISMVGVKMVDSLFCDLILRGVEISILTLPVSSYSDSVQDRTARAIESLLSMGVVVKQDADIYQHFAVFDDGLVWYGSANLISKSKNDDSMMRIHDVDVAAELIESARRG